jgi:hypothetical protein
VWIVPALRQELDRLLLVLPEIDGARGCFEDKGVSPTGQVCVGPNLKRDPLSLKPYPCLVNSVVEPRACDYDWHAGTVGAQGVDRPIDHLDTHLRSLVLRLDEPPAPVPMRYYVGASIVRLADEANAREAVELEKPDNRALVRLPR